MFFCCDTFFIFHLLFFYKHTSVSCFIVKANLEESELRPIVKRKKANTRSKRNQDVGEMLPETRTLLEKFYSPWNKRLANLLNDSLFLWTWKIRHSRLVVHFLACNLGTSRSNNLTKRRKNPKVSLRGRILQLAEKFHLMLWQWDLKAFFKMSFVKETQKKNKNLKHVYGG